MDNIYLVGIMGVGKTTIGRKLAKLINKPFIDTDQELEKRNGVTINHIFDIEGEAGFRLRETRLLKELGQEFNGIIATGGGIVTQAENLEVLANSGKVIYLKASLGTLWSRLRNSSSRPLLQTQNPKQKLAELITLREPMYESAATHVVSVGKGSTFQMAKRVQRLIDENAEY